MLDPNKIMEHFHAQDHEIERLRKERDELLAALENLVRVKGRHHTEMAYKRLVETYESVKGAE